MLWIPASTPPTWRCPRLPARRWRRRVLSLDAGLVALGSSSVAPSELPRGPRGRRTPRGRSLLRRLRGHLPLAARQPDSSRWLLVLRPDDDLLYRTHDAVDRRAFSSAALPGAERALLVATQLAGTGSSASPTSWEPPSVARRRAPPSATTTVLPRASGSGTRRPWWCWRAHSSTTRTPLGCVRSAMAAGATLVLLPATGRAYRGR
nr:hypothetical protein [Deltaproteobacteria bacterium]